MWDGLAKILAKIILVLGIYLGGRKAGRVDAENEALKQQTKVSDALLDEANRRTPDPGSTLDWLRNGGRGS